MSTEVQTVVMSDGRTVDFAGKRKMLKTPVIDANGIAIRIDFINGETRTVTIPEALYERFVAHGAAQKLGDEVAGVDDVDDMVMAIDSLAARIEAGEWSAKREKNGMAGASILAKALVESSGKSIETIREFLSTKTAAQKLALRQHSSIAPIVARLEEEKRAKSKKEDKPSIDTDSLLSELA